MKALHLPVSENKTFEIDFLCSYVPFCDHWGRACFDPMGIIWNNVIKVHSLCYMPNIKALDFPDPEMKNFLMLVFFGPCSDLCPPGHGQF